MCLSVQLIVVLLSLQFYEMGLFIDCKSATTGNPNPIRQTILHFAPNATSFLIIKHYHQINDLQSPS